MTNRIDEEDLPSTSQGARGFFNQGMPSHGNQPYQPYQVPSDTAHMPGINIAGPIGNQAEPISAGLRHNRVPIRQHIDPGFAMPHVNPAPPLIDHKQRQPEGTGPHISGPTVPPNISPTSACGT